MTVRLVACLGVVTTFLFIASPLHATPITITGATTGNMATASGELTLVGNVLTLSLTNTSPPMASITALGFDLVPGDFSTGSGLNGYISTPPGAFTFSEGALGNVPQFGSVLLDFGWITNNNGKFTGGDTAEGLLASHSLVFVVTGPFFGLTEQQLASALFVRFQGVGADGEDSDTGQGRSVPEPSMALLFAGGMLSIVRYVRRRRE